MDFFDKLFGSADFSNILLQLGLILLFAKFFGILARKIKLPQVVGYLVAGLLLGPAIWGVFADDFAIVHTNSIIEVLAQIGVIIIMFSAGVETDVERMKKSGLKSIAIACAGVFVPLALGFCIAIPFIGLDGKNWLSCLFIGTILTATSVGITVETLKELGVLQGDVGSTIVSAAIIDDVIGIIVLSIVISLGDANENPWITLLKIVLFFILGIGVGIGVYYLFKWLENKYPHTRRLPILALAVCFLYSWAAEQLFGIADITGAYVAGVILSLVKKENSYIDRKLEINSYTFFTPIFFVNIGLKIAFEGFTPQLILFAFCFVTVGIISKIVGAGGISKIMKYSWLDSAKIGIGMITRGEVALIVTEKGIQSGIIDQKYRVLVVLLILFTSVIAPITLKLLFKNEPRLPLVNSNELVK